jgi:protein-disulfide isomerase
MEVVVEAVVEVVLHSATITRTNAQTRLCLTRRRATAQPHVSVTTVPIQATSTWSCVNARTGPQRNNWAQFANTRKQQKMNWARSLGTRRLTFAVAVGAVLGGAIGAATTHVWSRRTLLAERYRHQRALALATRAEAPVPGPDSVAVTGLGAASQGLASAPMTLIYFTDYACPYCRRFALETLPALELALVRTGKVRIVVRDLPLHATSELAAAGARCAGQQAAYWQFHAALFTGAPDLSRTRLLHLADSLDLSSHAFTTCLDDPSIQAAVVADREEAIRAQIPGTPAFIVSSTSASDTAHGRLIVGALSIGAFRNALGGTAPPRTPSESGT